MRNLYLILILDLLIKVSNQCVPTLDFGDLDVGTNSGEVSRKVLVPAVATCANSNRKTKRVFYCYHDGVCQFKLVNINETHYTKSFYCVCQNGYGGDECREDNTFLVNLPHEQPLRFYYNKQTMLNCVLFTILVLITFSFVLYLVNFYQNKKNMSLVSTTRVVDTSSDESSIRMLNV